jgi:hypothetical protein
MRKGETSSLIPDKLGVVCIFTEIETSGDRHQMEIYMRDQRIISSPIIIGDSIKGSNCVFDG